MNLLKETIKILHQNKKFEKDVLFVSAGKIWCSWDDFEARANFEYDNSYGGNEINLCLRIVGSDWWLERGEYDGSEWWEFKTLPKKPNNLGNVDIKES